MALEAGDGFISGLVITNPVNSTDQVAQGDDHLRLIKTALKGTFPNLNGAVNATPAQLNVLATDGAGAGMLADIAAIADPGADRLLGWDESANAAIAFSLSTGLTSSGTAILIDTAVVPRLNAANTFTGGDIGISNASDPALVVTDTTGPTISVLQSTNSVGLVGTLTAHPFDLYAGGSLRIRIDASGNYDFNAGTVTTDNVSASEVGTKGVPRVSKTADYTIAAVDSGTELVLSSAADDITVQASGQPAAGMVVFLENATGGSVDIVQGTGMTLTLDGTATTGSRTLAANGRGYVRFTGAGTASVGGLGVA